MRRGKGQPLTSLSEGPHGPKLQHAPKNGTDLRHPRRAGAGRERAPTPGTLCAASLQSTQPELPAGDLVPVRSTPPRWHPRCSEAPSPIPRDRLASRPSGVSQAFSKVTKKRVGFNLKIFVFALLKTVHCRAERNPGRGIGRLFNCNDSCFFIWREAPKPKCLPGLVSPIKV